MQIAKYIFIDFCWTTTKQQAKNWKIVVSAGNKQYVMIWYDARNFFVIFWQWQQFTEIALFIFCCCTSYGPFFPCIYSPLSLTLPYQTWNMIVTSFFNCLNCILCILHKRITFNKSQNSCGMKKLWQKKFPRWKWLFIMNY